MDRLPITRIPSALRPILGDATPTYPKVYLATLSGRFPAEQGDNGRWSVLKSDLAAIAEAFRTPRARRSAVAG